MNKELVKEWLGQLGDVLSDLVEHKRAMTQNLKEIHQLLEVIEREVQDDK